ncbi:hypothetical protein EV714DRAFT_277716 [Schizophyllum commune]
MFPLDEPDVLPYPPSDPQPFGRQSVIFSSTEGEIIVFRSCDGLLLNIDRRYLKWATDGPLAVDVPATPGENTALEEDSETLETLFAFVHPRRHPLLDSIPFTQLFKFAEAAEKYRVFPAMSVANVRMSMAYKDHPLKVMSYACKHGYMDLLDRTAPLSIGTPVSAALGTFDYLPLFIAWVQYNDNFHQIDKALFTLVAENSHKTCSAWTKIQDAVSRAHVQTHLSPSNLDILFAGTDVIAGEYCGQHRKSTDTPKEVYCNYLRKDWMARAQRRMHEIPALSQFLK